MAISNFPRWRPAPKLIIRVINFELVQPVCPRYVNVTDRQTRQDTSVTGWDLVTAARQAQMVEEKRMKNLLFS